MRKKVRVIDICLPASKSYTNRALVCAALAEGTTRLFRYTPCEDTEYMIRALQKMGIKVKLKTQNSKPKTSPRRTSGQTTQNSKEIHIQGGMNNLRIPDKEVFVGNAGTTLRFLTTLCGLVVAKKGGAALLTGSPRMQERPIGDLVDALQALGMHVQYIKKEGYPPIQCQKANVKRQKLGGEISLRGDASSQYLSSILLCAPYFDIDTKVEIKGNLTSKPYVDMTIAVMKDFGVPVEHNRYRTFYVRRGKKYHARKYSIEPDASAAGYFVAGAVLCGKRVAFPGLRADSLQGDVRFNDIVLRMKRGKGLCGSIVDMNEMPDMVPTLAVLSMFARGTTRISNVKNLRIKETDRIRALVTEIRKFGVMAHEFPDGLSITGDSELKNKRVNARIKTYNDHRMAMAFAVAKLVFPDILIENPRCVAKSFPEFWEEWRKMINLKPET